MEFILAIFVAYDIYLIIGKLKVLRRQRDTLLSNLNDFLAKLVSLSEAGLKKNGWDGNNKIIFNSEDEAEDFIIIDQYLMPIANEVSTHCKRLLRIPFSFVPENKSVEYVREKYKKYLPILNIAYKKFMIK